MISMTTANAVSCPPWCTEPETCNDDHIGQPVEIETADNGIVLGLEHAGGRPVLVLADAIDGWAARLSPAEASDLAAALTQLAGIAQ